MIYLDNAATTYPKPAVIYTSVLKAMRCYGGNPGRSSHGLSLAAAEAIYRVRELLAASIGLADPEGIVFTSNATHAINVALKSYIDEGSHILISDIEHNSVIRPLEALRRYAGIEYDIFSSADPERTIRAKIKANSRYIVSTLCSNVTGDMISLDLLSRLKRELGLGLIVDASQVLGHEAIDLSRTPVDVLCGPGHKGLFGIMGSGFAAFADTKRKKSFIEGGSGTESRSTDMPTYLPEGYEAGTLGVPAICSLGAGIEFINSIGQDEIKKKTESLTEELAQRLSALPKVRLYSAKSGIACFNFNGLTSSECARLLDERSIYLRGGLHCAPSAHKLLGTLDVGAVRASVSYLNSKKDIDGLYRELKTISKIY